MGILLSGLLTLIGTKADLHLYRQSFMRLLPCLALWRAPWMRASADWTEDKLSHLSFKRERHNGFRLS